MCMEDPTAKVENCQSKPKSKWRPLPLDTGGRYYRLLQQTYQHPHHRSRVGEVGVQEAETQCQEDDDHRGEALHPGPDLLPQDRDQQVPHRDESLCPGGDPESRRTVGRFRWQVR